MPQAAVRHRVFAAAALLLLPVLSACSVAPEATGPGEEMLAPPPARINHIVFFDLLEAGDAPALIADSRASLGPIPEVRSLFCGRHVDAGRAAVRTDYDVCVYVGFDSLDDYAAYVEDPRHKALVARWQGRMEGYRVYDVLDESTAAR